MTPYAEADPAPEQPWRETSQRGVRLMALKACEAAVRAAKERQPSGETGDAHEPAQVPAYGTNSRRADTVSSDTGQNVQRDLGGAA